MATDERRGRPANIRIHIKRLIEGRLDITRAKGDALRGITRRDQAMADVITGGRDC